MAQSTKARARRAAAPTKASSVISDENAPSQRSSISAAVNKLAGNAAGMTGPLKLAKEGKAASAASVAGAPRRALGDVSNANKAKPIDRSSKEVLNKPVRSRPASQSSIASVTSLNTGITKTNTALSSKSANATHTKSLSAATGRNVITRSSTASLRGDARRRSQSENTSAPKVQQGPWPGAEAVEEEEPVEVLAGRKAPPMDISEENDHEYRSASQQSAQTGAEAYLEEAELGSDDAVMQDDVSVVSASAASASQASSGASMDPDNWLIMDPVEEAECRRMVAEIQKDFDDELDFWDSTMVAEYSDEIFAYMAAMEDKTMPHPNYMGFQSELDWSTRVTLIEWLLQIHMRYHMLPETLWIAVNIIDRFLSKRVVSLVKLQLVGITAIFVAAKYEEIMAPSVEEFVTLTDNGYSKEEILKGERIVLQTLDFNISPYSTPYSWVRRISKADDYDIQTRTLSKFLMEVTLLDHRFLRAKPSMIAALGMYLSRRMLGGSWSDAFVFYSGLAEAQLRQPAAFVLQALAEPEFERKFVYRKYSTKKFLKASIFATSWARNHPEEF